MATDTIAQHTEGPWRLGDCCDIVATIDRVQRTIAFTSPFADGGMVEAERHANARLIAAAPDLLAAAKYALSVAEAFINDQYQGTSRFDGAMADLQPVRDVIAKAEGAR